MTTHSYSRSLSTG